VSLDPTWLFVSLIPGGVGFVLFVYGKKQGRWPHMVAGLPLMVYPYSATSLVSLVATGAVIGFILWYGRAPRAVSMRDRPRESSVLP
jgi:hypothetical protein